MENSIKEDIKIVENYLAHSAVNEIDSDFFKNGGWEIVDLEIPKSMQHILSDYERVLKKNEELLELKVSASAHNRILELEKENKNLKVTNKDLQKSVDMIYADYQDIGNKAFEYSDKIEQQNKMIDLMAEYISNIRDCPFENEGKYLDCEKMCDIRTDMECWKQYFENKAKEV